MRTLSNLFLIVTWLAVMFLHGQAPAGFGPFTSRPDHLAVLFILDDSGSMKYSDPTGLRYTAASLFVAALDPGDQAGGLPVEGARFGAFFLKVLRHVTGNPGARPAHLAANNGDCSHTLRMRNQAMNSLESVTLLSVTLLPGGTGPCP